MFADKRISILLLLVHLQLLLLVMFSMRLSHAALKVQQLELVIRNNTELLFLEELEVR